MGEELASDTASAIPSDIASANAGDLAATEDYFQDLRQTAAPSSPAGTPQSLQATMQAAQEAFVDRWTPQDLDWMESTEDEEQEERREQQQPQEEERDEEEAEAEEEQQEEEGGQGTGGMTPEQAGFLTLPNGQVALQPALEHCRALRHRAVWPGADPHNEGARITAEQTPLPRAKTPKSRGEANRSPSATSSGAKPAPWE